MYALTIYCDNGNGKYVDSKSGTYSPKRIDQLMPVLLNNVSDPNSSVISFEVTKSGDV